MHSPTPVAPGGARRLPGRRGSPCGPCLLRGTCSEGPYGYDSANGLGGDRGEWHAYSVQTRKTAWLGGVQDHQRVKLTAAAGMSVRPTPHVRTARILRTLLRAHRRGLLYGQNGRPCSAPGGVLSNAPLSFKSGLVTLQNLDSGPEPLLTCQVLELRFECHRQDFLMRMSLQSGNALWTLCALTPCPAGSKVRSSQGSC